MISDKTHLGRQICLDCVHGLSSTCEPMLPDLVGLRIGGTQIKIPKTDAKNSSDNWYKILSQKNKVPLFMFVEVPPLYSIISALFSKSEHNSETKGLSLLFRPTLLGEELYI